MATGKTGPAQEIETEYSKITRNDFPDDFIFGTGTSAYQHEGGAAKGGRGLSVWDVFTLRTPGKILDGSNGNVAVDMYTRYKEDIKMMKSMGFEAYRFSISWSRILPGGKLCLGVNKEGIDYYNDLINTLLANGIQPYVTLFHWDLPHSLEQEYGGFLSKNIVDDFRDFAELCFWEFGDRVKYWMTLNEPWTYCVQGYVKGVFPPGKVRAADSAPAPILASTTIATTLANSGLTSESVDKSGDNRIHRAIGKTGNNFIPYRGFNRKTSDLNFVTYSVVNDPIISMHAMPSKESFVHSKTRSQSSKRSGSADHDHGSEYITNLAKDAYTVARNLLLAHAAAVQSYRDRFQEHQKGKIGITLVSHWFEPLTVTEKDEEAAKRGLDFMLGWFLEPVLTGCYPQNMIKFVPSDNLASFSEEESELLKGSIDFLGLNYYTALYAEDDPNPLVQTGYYKDQQAAYTTKKCQKSIGEESGAWWLLIVPWGIHKLLKYIDNTYNNSNYKLPDIYITENGVADKMDHSLTAYEACRDKMRVNYYRDHLGNTLKAIKEGVKIKGYFAWSWSDNFEWADGYTFRFGIIYIDYVNHLRRCPKDSAMWFAKFLLKMKLVEPESEPAKSESKSEYEPAKSESKPESKSKSESEPAKSESKPESKSKSESEPAKSESKPESEPAKSESKSEYEPAKSESKPESKSKSESEPAKSESKPESEPAKSESKPESEPAKSESKPESKSKSESEPAKSESKPESEPAKSESKPESEPAKSESKPESKPKSESEPESEADCEENQKQNQKEPEKSA